MENENKGFFDPANGMATSDPSGGQWFSPASTPAIPGMCHNTPDGLQPEVQTMSYNTPDGKPPESACWGYGSTFFDPRSMGGADDKPYSANMWFEGTTVNTAMRPHAMCMADADGYLQLTINGPEGQIEDNKAKIGPDEFVEVIWVAYGAISMSIDGVKVDTQGTRIYTFDADLLGAKKPLRTITLVAEFLNRKPISSTIELKMVAEKVGWITEWRRSFRVETKLSIPILGGYFTIKSQVLSGEISFQPKQKGDPYSAGYSKRCSREHVERVFSLVWDFGKVDICGITILRNHKAELNLGGRKTLQDGTIRLAVDFKYVATTPLLPSYEGDHGKFELSREYELVGAAFSIEKKPGKKWEEPKIFNLQVSGAYVAKGTLKYQGYSFDVSGKIKCQFSVEPNWVRILPLLGGAIIPIAIVIAGVATIWVNMHALRKIWDIKKCRNEISNAAKDIARGYMDGVRGYAPTKTNFSGVKHFYESGVAKGASKRAELLKNQFKENGVLLSDWLIDNAEEAQKEAYQELFQRLSAAAWNEYGNDHWGFDGMVLNAQKWDWYYIYGGTCPQKMGPEFVALWKDVRREDSSQPELSAGIW